MAGNLRSDRVMLRDAGEPRSGPKGGRPRKHGGVFTLAKPDSWHLPEVTTHTDTTRYGKAETQAWDRIHPRLTHRGPWLDHQGELPLPHGTLIRLKVDHLPGERDANPLWLWCSATGTDPAHTDLLWQSFFRLLKQTLGWTAPKFRSPHTADLWTWLIITAHTQLRLARPLAEDLRRPWERPAPPNQLTPARVRRGFRNIRPKTQPDAWPRRGQPQPAACSRDHAEHDPRGRSVLNLRR